MPHPQTSETGGERRWRAVTLYFALWTFIGLLSTSQYYSFYRFENLSYPFWRIMMWQMPGWYLWGALTPLVRFLGRRFSIERGRWLAPAAIHLLLSVVIALAHLSAVMVFRWLFRPQTVEPAPFLNLWLSTFAGAFHIELLTYFVILGAGYSMEFYRRYRERELAAAQLETQLAQAQLQALKMQLHPHFLFNTLHTIAMLVRKQESQTAVRMISGLSDLLRYVLRQGEAQEIPLKQEVEFIEQYLEIEQLRFQDRMRVRYELAPETLDAGVPNLILQPLVENAIRHGLGSRAEAGLVEIRSWRDNGMLWLSVRDDGQGLGANWQTRASQGVGLSNTRARLQKLYGGGYRFDLQNDRENDRAEGTAGTIATLGIPFHAVSGND